jgi:phosphate transport system ATP-binding protein
MHQATRVSDYTAFFYMGNLIEYDRTDKLFSHPTNPQTEAYISGLFS